MCNSAEASDTREPCGLLKLPPELRNRIYREAMVAPDRSSRIIITSTGYHRSGLLQTCKQIRAETYRIFYSENTFQITILNYDSSTRLSWHNALIAALAKGLIKIGDPIMTEIVPMMIPGDSPSLWRNLMIWLSHVHSGRGMPYLARESNDISNSQHALAQRTKQCIIASMFTTVKELRDLPWRRVETILNGMRPGLVKVEGRFSK